MAFFSYSIILLHTNGRCDESIILQTTICMVGIMKKIALIFIGLICIGSIDAGQKCCKGAQQKTENFDVLKCVQCSGNCVASNHVCTGCNNAICSRCESSFLMSADIFRSNKRNLFFVNYSCNCGQHTRLYVNQDDRKASMAARVFNNGHRFQEVHD